MTQLPSFVDLTTLIILVNFINPNVIKQAPHAWFERLISHIQTHGFHGSSADSRHYSSTAMVTPLVHYLIAYRE